MKTCLLLFLCFLATTFADPEENIGGDGNLFEGDMRLTSDQRAAVKGLTRASIKTNKWTGAVLTYTIAASLANEANAMDAIQAAMNEWEQMTCISFQERTTEQNYVEFFKGSGCWSYVGMIGGKQQISLASGCWYKGTVIHEIGHALGFYHEQSRPDRDDYVTIQWDNILEGYEHNFNKYSTSIIDSLGTPYDYGSIMHYGSHYFSKNGQATIVSKPPGKSFGQRNGLSDIDANQMDLRYGC